MRSAALGVDAVLVAQPLRSSARPRRRTRRGRRTGRAPRRWSPPGSLSKSARRRNGSCSRCARLAISRSRLVDQRRVACRARWPGRAWRAAAVASTALNSALKGSSAAASACAFAELAVERRQQRLRQRMQVPPGDVGLARDRRSGPGGRCGCRCASGRSRRGSRTARSRSSGPGSTCCRCSSRRGKSRPPAIAPSSARCAATTCSSRPAAAPARRGSSG